jgi:acyl dehydratase
MAKPLSNEQLQQFVGGDFGPFLAWDAINAPMIRHWCEVMGETNPVYTDVEAAQLAGFSGLPAPPAMMQAWIMPGHSGERPPGSGEGSAMAVLEVLREAGYEAVVGVNCEQEYFAHLLEGDRVYFRSTCESISDEKHTALGDGYFVTELSRFYNQRDELVGTMRFRVLQYRPGEAAG